KATETEFRAAMEGSGLGVEWRPVVTSDSLSAYLADESYGADLVITGVDRSTSLFDTSRHVDVGDFVMQAGRPCLIVPAALERFSLDHVVVGWKDGCEARRAASDALPLLKVAGRVSVVAIAAKEDVEDAQARLTGVAGWLQRHGIAAETVVASVVGDDAGQLGALAQELGATLLVAGAYGHSRVREWALGGVTRDLLLRAERCALVSH
ncbi:MAG TPA: universal stress protein, partial [Rhodopila sp.]|nr:universal stress protein [Rhodopila sp.]